jgi:hypothetical protein
MPSLRALFAFPVLAWAIAGCGDDTFIATVPSEAGASSGSGSSGSGSTLSGGSGSDSGGSSGSASSSGSGEDAGAEASLPTTDASSDSGVSCGAVTCPVGQSCCNSSCGICTLPGSACAAVICEPDAGSGSSVCKTDSNCRLFDDSCTGCDCRALDMNQADPICSSPGLSCLMEPCAGKSAACVGGQCVAQ